MFVAPAFFFFFSADNLMPVSLAEAKAWLKIDAAEDDEIVRDLVRTAAERIEERAWAVSGGERAIELQFDSFDHLPVYPAPLVSITALTYTATDGTTATVAPENWQLRSRYGVPIIEPVIGYTWPEIAPRSGAVQLSVRAGWANRALVPAQLRTAVRMLIAHWYENRGSAMQSSELPKHVETLLSPWRKRLLV